MGRHAPPRQVPTPRLRNERVPRRKPTGRPALRAAGRTNDHEDVKGGNHDGERGPAAPHDRPRVVAPTVPPPLTAPGNGAHASRAGDRVATAGTRSVGASGRSSRPPPSATTRDGPGLRATWGPGGRSTHAEAQASARSEERRTGTGRNQSGKPGNGGRMSSLPESSPFQPGQLHGGNRRWMARRRRLPMDRARPAPAVPCAQRRRAAPGPRGSRGADEGRGGTPFSPRWSSMSQPCTVIRCRNG